jgi:hypothetical protein
MQTILLYAMIGVVWSFWLERFTTKNLQPPYNNPWTNSERMVHILFWPITLLVFLHNFFTDIFK